MRRYDLRDRTWYPHKHVLFHLFQNSVLVYFPPCLRLQKKEGGGVSIILLLFSRVRSLDTPYIEECIIRFARNLAPIFFAVRPPENSHHIIRTRKRVRATHNRGTVLSVPLFCQKYFLIGQGSSAIAPINHCTQGTTQYQPLCRLNPIRA